MNRKVLEVFLFTYALHVYTAGQGFAKRDESQSDEVNKRAQCGPRCDYAAVVTKATESYWTEFAFLSTRSGATPNDFVGPLRVSVPRFNNSSTGNDKYHHSYIIRWECRDSFAWWSDGTSNQLVVGEKFIPKFALGSDLMNHKRWDGGYLSVWPSEQIFNVGRFIHRDYRCLVANPNDPGVTSGQLPSNHWGHYGFGSNHTGTVNFMVGDGSVHGISGTISTEVLYNLARVNDGNASTIP
jgi:hypothetical protein